MHADRFAQPDPADESQAKLSRVEACQSKKTEDGSKTTLSPTDFSIFCPTEGGTKFGMVLMNGLMTASHVVFLAASTVLLSGT